MSCHHANKIRWTQNNSVSVFTLDLCSSLLQLWLPQTEKHLSPWLLIILTKSRQHASLLYSQPALLRAMMRVRANSNQLIFYSTRVPVFVAFASWNCVRMQVYNTGPVTLSSTSLPFILLLCEQTAVGLFFFFSNSYHYSSLEAQKLHSKSLMEAYLVESGLEMRLPWGYGHKGEVGVDGF